MLFRFARPVDETDSIQADCFESPLNMANFSQGGKKGLALSPARKRNCFADPYGILTCEKLMVG